MIVAHILIALGALCLLTGLIGLFVRLARAMWGGAKRESAET